MFMRCIIYTWKLENVSAKVKSQQSKTVNRKAGTSIKKKNCLAIVTWYENTNFNSTYNSSLIKILLGNANRHWANNFIYLSGTLQLSSVTYTLVTSKKVWAKKPSLECCCTPMTTGCFEFSWSLEHVSVEVQGLGSASRCTDTFVFPLISVQGIPCLIPTEKGHGLDDTQSRPSAPFFPFGK